MRLLTILLLFTLACSPPLRQRTVLVIGDSNAAAADGWATQFQRLRGGGPLVNTSVAGNTIGFNNNGRTEPNTLENLTNYLRRGYAEMGSIDEIIVGLGTNDCKAEFADRRQDIAQNLANLLDRTNTFFDERGQERARIVLLTPPPVADDAAVADEYSGTHDCVAELSNRIRQLARERQLCLVDWQDDPGSKLLENSPDGIHFSPAGYRLLAEAIVERCY